MNLQENIQRIKEVMLLKEVDSPEYSVIEILVPLAYMDNKYKYQVVPHSQTQEDKIYIKKGSAGNKTISTKNIKVVKTGSKEDMEKHLDKLMDKKDDTAKFITCKNCRHKFTQTIHKGKKSLPICPTCGTHN